MTSPVKIAPTVGRMVWFYMALSQLQAGQQPHAAQIAYVHTPEEVPDGEAPGVPHQRINISWLDAHGVQQPRSDVLLVQEGETPPDREAFCTWMPFQQGQARSSPAPTTPVDNVGAELFGHERQGTANPRPG